jgi:hypothetical protein
MNKISLGKKIFQYKNATDEEIEIYCDLIKLDPSYVREISKKIKNYRKYFEHYTRFGDKVTIEKFLSRPITSNSNKIAEHYGVNVKKKIRRNVYDPEYISRREGITFSEAEIYIEKYKNNKSTSLANFIKRYGEEEGLKKYDMWYSKSLKKGHDPSLNKIKSKFSKHYYLKRGFSECESIEMANQYQYQNSPLHIEYYTLRGLDIDSARKKIRKIHDKKIGIDSYRQKLEKDGLTSLEINDIIKDSKGYFTRIKLGDDKFEEILSKIRNTFELNGRWIPLEDMSDYELYRKSVWFFTNQNELCELKNFEKRGLAGVEGAYQLDHKYSILTGYINSVPPEVIGSLPNLEFIPWLENVKKQSKCSITIEELNENQ